MTAGIRRLADLSTPLQGLDLVEGKAGEARDGSRGHPFPQHGTRRLLPAQQLAFSLALGYALGLAFSPALCLAFRLALDEVEALKI